MIPQHIKAIIFDMDGLLIDSEPYWEKGDAAFFSKHDKKHTPEINKRIMGMGQREIIELFKKEYGFEGDTNELMAERKGLVYSFLLKDIQLMKGAEELLRLLHKKHYAMAIATSGHTREKTAEILEHLNIDQYFSVLVSGDDVHKSKPAPDIYLKTAELMHVEPSNCLVFEDAPNGAQAGKAAGMVVYGVNRDEAISNKLRKAGVDKLFNSLRIVIV